MQEAWLRCHQINPDNPLNFLYRVIRNLALDAQRRTTREDRRFVWIEDGVRAEIAADIPGQDNDVAARQELGRVMEQFNALPELTKQAMILYRVDGLKLREISRILDISISRVHGLVAEGMEQCRQADNSSK